MKMQKNPTMRSSNEPIYLDYASTTPTSEAVLAAMEPYWRCSGNPGSQHPLGKIAKQAVDMAEERILRGLNAPAGRIVFTASATEANNLAILGFMQTFPAKTSHFIVGATEHASVLSPARYLEQLGYALTILPVDGVGQPVGLELAIRPETRLVSLMAANNEIGTIPDLKAIAKLCSRHGIVLHTDASQAVGKVPFDLTELPGKVLVTISGHKIYGPMGIGALAIRSTDRQFRLQPQILGGGQQGGFRSGTLPVPLIVGLGAAIEAVPEMVQRHGELASLRDSFEFQLMRSISSISINGDMTSRLPHLSSISFDKVYDFKSFINCIYQDGICFGTTSACHAGLFESSHVLAAIKVPQLRADCTIRVSLGLATEESHLRTAIAAVCKARCILKDQEMAWPSSVGLSPRDNSKNTCPQNSCGGG